MTRLAYDNSVWDATAGVRVRTHDFTSFEISAAEQGGRAAAAAGCGDFARGAKLELACIGLQQCVGADAGRRCGTHLLYRSRRCTAIYRWNAAAKQAETADRPGSVCRRPSLRFVAPHTLLAVDLQQGGLQRGYGERRWSRSWHPLPRAGRRDRSLLPPVGFPAATAWTTSGVKQMDRRGVVYARGSNMAITAAVTDEHRDFFYAPGTKTAVMAGAVPGSPCCRRRSGALCRSAGSVWRRVKRMMPSSLHHAEQPEGDCGLRRSLTSRGGSSVVTHRLLAGQPSIVAGGQLYIYSAAGKADRDGRNS